MQVNINNEPFEISEDTSLEGLLQSLNHPTNGIAIAINEDIIAKSDWNKVSMKANDRVLIIKAVKGG